MVRKLGRWLSALAIVAATCVGSGCGKPATEAANVCKIPPRPQFPTVSRRVFIDPRLSEDAHNEVVQALMDWTASTRGIVKWQLFTILTKAELGEPPEGTCSDAIIIGFFPSDAPLIKQLEEENGTSITAATYTTCEFSFTAIAADRITSLDEIRVTVEHELGHFLGLHNTDDKKRLMYRGNDGGATCVTKADLKDFCEKWKCDSSLLDPCD